MKRVLEAIRKYGVSISISIFLSAPIGIVAAVLWLEQFEDVYSFRTLFTATLVILACLAIGICFIARHFLSWLRGNQLIASRRDILLFFCALIPLGAAVYYGLESYSGSWLFNSYNPPFKVAIMHADSIQSPGRVCILEMTDQSGRKIRPENDSDAGFSRGEGWTLRDGECQYLLSESNGGSLSFYYTILPAENFQILFQENNAGGKALVRINGELMVEVNLQNGQGNRLVSVPLQPSRVQLFLWKAFVTAGLLSILIVLLMLAVSLLGKSRLPEQVPALFAFVEKHPWIGLVPVAIWAAIMFWPSAAWASSDVAYYLSLAKNLYHGNGYVNADLSPAIYRGPVLPLLIAFSYVIFGESFRSAVILERVFWVLTVLISYVLGTKLFNHRVGFLTALFTLSAAVINRAFHYVWTDGPLVFIILVLQWLFWEAYKKQPGYRWYLLMGTVLGIAYLLKQTAVLIAPLPFMMWALLAEYRNLDTLKKLLTYSVIFTTFVAGWMAYVYLSGGSNGQILGDFSKGLSVISRFTNILNPQATPVETGTVQGQGYSISLLEVLNTYYNRDIVRFFRIAILFPVALIFTLYQAVIRKSRADVFLISGLILFSYLIPSQVVVNFGYRNNLYFYVIGMICIAAMVDRIFSRMSAKSLPTVVIFVVASSLLLIQISGGDYVLPDPTPIKNQITMDYFSTVDQTIAAWVDEHVQPNEVIMMSEREGNILHILTHGNRRFGIINMCRGEEDFWPVVPCRPPYISFWIYNGVTDPDVPRDVIFGISEPLFLAKISEMDVQYIIVTPRNYSLYYYLLRHPDFEEIKIVGDFPIFRVLAGIKPLSSYVKWETCLGEGTSEYLKNLEQSDPTRYRTIYRQKFEPWMGLSGTDLETFKNWKGCEFGAFTGSYSLPE